MRTIWSRVGATALLLPAIGAAQPPQPARQARVMIAAHQPLGGACASLIAGPSDLVRTPEGRATLRLKKELDDMSMVIEQRGTPPEPANARKMIEMRRGVDSMMKMSVQYFNADGSTGTRVTVTRADTSPIMVDGRLLNRGAAFEAMEVQLRSARPELEKLFTELRQRPGEDLEIRLRSMEPRVAEMARAMAASSAPVGYLGLNLSGSQIRIVTDTGSFTSHCDYPMIEAVDVPSPARTAGLNAGDTLVAYNGRDVMAQAINYPKLLTPGSVVRIMVRRDGKKREVPVTVSERPPEMADKNVVFYSRSAVPRASTGSASAGAGGAASGGVIARVSPSMPAQPAAGSVQGFAISPAGPGGALTSVTTFVHGATLSTVDDDFAQTLGVEPGVLILRVQPGSAAAESGMRGGEMIRAVNGSPVRDLVLLQRLLRTTDSHVVKLTVSGRDTPARIVTLKF